jgi:hypothetical protein
MGVRYQNPGFMPLPFIYPQLVCWISGYFGSILSVEVGGYLGDGILDKR